MSKLYHQTDAETAEVILRTQRMKPGSGGLAGGGIYFATTPELTGHKAHKKGVILEATVSLGKVLTLDATGDPDMTLRKLKSKGFDSVCIARKVSSGQEYVVYDPEQVLSIVRVLSPEAAEKERNKRAHEHAKILIYCFGQCLVKAAGYSCKDAREAGMLSTCKDARAAGFTCKDALLAGFTCKDASEAGFTWEDAKEAGFTFKDLREAGFNCKDAREAGLKGFSNAAMGSTFSLQLNNYPDHSIQTPALRGMVTAELYPSLQSRSLEWMPGVKDDTIRISPKGSPNIVFRHRGFELYADPYDPGDGLLGLDSSFYVRPGNANASQVSFESVNFPGHFLRHAGFRLFLHPKDGSALFNADSTFQPIEERQGLPGFFERLG